MSVAARFKSDSPLSAITTAADPSKRRRTDVLVLGAIIGVVLVVLLSIVSIALGAKSIPVSTVLDSFFNFDGSNNDHLIILSLRVPRTVLGIVVGLALGASGAIMQGVARNPLADPGILGINAGAALFVVIGIYVFGITALSSYVWFAFIGAAVAVVAVYAIGSLGREGATPIKLALAGAAATAFMGAMATALVIDDVNTLDQYRFWVVGSLAGRTGEIATQAAIFIGIGAVLAVATGPLLNSLALGDDMAKGLGERVAVSRIFCAVVVVILTGAATAACGPIGFVGLAVPHMVRFITGPDYRWIVIYSMIYAPLLLLGADIIGRVIASPGEVQVGIVTAILGAPIFILLVRYRKLAEM